MKKISIPLAIPIILSAIIVILIGTLTFTALKESKEQKVEIAPPQKEDTIRPREINSAITRARGIIDELGAIKTSRLKGSHLSSAAMELMKADAYCGDGNNLRLMLSHTSKQLHLIGDKLWNGGELTEQDTNNIAEIKKALDNANSSIARAIDEDNTDYLRGEFHLPAIQTMTEPIPKEQAEKTARHIVGDAVLKEEKDNHYRFDGDDYILEVAKGNGSIMYRKRGYTLMGAELTDSKLTELTEKAKAFLKEKGFGDMALMSWQAKDGEINMLLYPVINNAIYLDAPFGLILSISDGQLLGIKTSIIKEKTFENTADLEKKLKEQYGEYNYIIKAVNSFGVPCLMVSSSIGESEYLSLYLLSTLSEAAVYKIENNSYGRFIHRL